jgi:hypothetical protein
MAEMSLKDRIKKKMKEQANSSGSWTLNIPEGVKQLDKIKTRMNLDFIPYKTSNNPECAPGETFHRRRYGTHGNLGVDNKVRICPAYSFGLPCPVCERNKKLFKGTAEDQEIAKAQNLKKRELYNIIDADDEEAGIQIWDVSYHNFGKMLEEEINSDDTDEYAGFPELKGGYTLKCRFKEESFNNNNFMKVSRIDFEKREDFDKDILKEVTDLDKCLKLLSYEELEAELYGTAVAKKAKETEEEEVEEKAPPKKSFRVKKKEEPKEEVVEETEEEEAPFDVPEEKEEPKKEAVKRTRKTEAKTEESSEACPHGHKYGIDTDGKDECETCSKWEACGDEYEKRKKARK